MQELIETGDELHKWYLSLYALNEYHRQKWIDKGVMVTTKVRREYLTSEHQAGFILGGHHMTASFKSLGGGVWLASVENYKPIS